MVVRGGGYLVVCRDDAEATAANRDRTPKGQVCAEGPKKDGGTRTFVLTCRELPGEHVSIAPSAPQRASPPLASSRRQVVSYRLAATSITCVASPTGCCPGLFNCAVSHLSQTASHPVAGRRAACRHRSLRVTSPKLYRTSPGHASDTEHRPSDPDRQQRRPAGQPEAAGGPCLPQAFADVLQELIHGLGRLQGNFHRRSGAVLPSQTDALRPTVKRQPDPLASTAPQPHGQGPSAAPRTPPGSSPYPAVWSSNARWCGSCTPDSVPATTSGS